MNSNMYYVNCANLTLLTNLFKNMMMNPFFPPMLKIFLIKFICCLYFMFMNLNLMLLELNFLYLAKIMLVCLTLWIIPILVACNFSPMYSWFYYYSLKKMMLMLLAAFLTTKIMAFFMFFEGSIVPILMLIIGWGGQPERMKAGLYLFYYTLFGSLPLFIMIMWFYKSGFVWTYAMLSLIRPFEFVEIWMVSGAFLIKMPFYLGHMWLPKAHVEAPLVGSMVLASLMLKLGGLGLILLMKLPLIQSFLLNLIICSSLFGGAVISFLIVRLVDMKLIVAYSSVIHMSLVIVGSFLSSPLGASALLMMMICHGLTSPGMFLGVTIMYNWSHTRSTVLNKGVLGVNPTFSLMWFTMIVLNFGGPFTLNLLCEIMLIGVVISSSMISVMLLSVISFFSLVYNLILYSSLNQGINMFSPWVTKVCMKDVLFLLVLILPCFMFLGIQF